MTAWRCFWRWLVLLAAIYVVIWLAIAPASAQVKCASHDRMVAALAHQYGEAVKADGTVSRSRIMELFVSAEGSWSLVITTAEGFSCIVAGGFDYQERPWLPGDDS